MLKARKGGKSLGQNVVRGLIRKGRDKADAAGLMVKARIYKRRPEAADELWLYAEDSGESEVFMRPIRYYTTSMLGQHLENAVDGTVFPLV